MEHAPTPKHSRPAGNSIDMLATLDDIERLAQFYVGCGMAKDLNHGVVAIFTAKERGIAIGTLLNHSYVVNGKLAIYGELPLSLANTSGLVESFSEWWTLGAESHAVFPEDQLAGLPLKEWPDDLTAWCASTRRDRPGTVQFSFSVRQAKLAGLWLKKNFSKRTRSYDQPSPWMLYPQDMLPAKARARVLRRLYPEALLGLGIAEDLEGHQEPREAEFSEKPSASSTLAQEPTEPAPWQPANEPEPAALPQSTGVSAADVIGKEPQDQVPAWAQPAASPEPVPVPQPEQIEEQALAPPVPHPNPLTPEEHAALDRQLAAEEAEQDRTALDRWAETFDSPDAEDYD